MLKKEFLFLIVIYNIKCADSTTYNILLEQVRWLKEKKKITIVIYDNSTNNDVIKYNIKFCNKRKVDYLTMKENIGLSKAYNTVIRKYDFKWLCLLDQDSYLENNFVNQVIKAIEQHGDIPLHLPWVLSNGKIISPSRLLWKHVIIPIHNKTVKIKLHNLTAINSGMVICKSVFNKVGFYNENYFLDYIDHNFMRNYRSNFVSYNIIDTEIQQNFSNDFNDYKKDKIRFKIYIKDFYLFCKDSLAGLMYFYLKIIYRAIKLVIRHKKISFISFLLKFNIKGRE